MNWRGGESSEPLNSAEPKHVRMSGIWESLRRNEGRYKVDWKQAPANGHQLGYGGIQTNSNVWIGRIHGPTTPEPILIVLTESYTTPLAEHCRDEDVILCDPDDYAYLSAA